MTNDRRRADGPVQRLAAKFAVLPRLGRWTLGGAVCLGGIGMAAGLVIGLIVHPLTAPFAVIELGLPAAIVGGLIGLVAGAIAAAGARISQRS